MKLFIIITILVAADLADAAKILVYDYKFQRSHVQFTNTIADILVDEGHDVVMLSNVLDSSLRDVGSSRVRRYFTEQTPEAKQMRFFSQGANHWKSRGFHDWIRSFDMTKYVAAMTAQCVDVLHKAGITNYALIESHSTLLKSKEYNGVPDQHSTMPGRFASFSEMSFKNRLKNFAIDTAKNVLPYVISNDFRTRVEENFEGAPDFNLLAANVSMVFLNRVPAIDFPSLTTHTTVDIGGLTITKTNKSVDEKWSSIFSLRPRTILISFGTISHSSDMPGEFKKSLLQAVKAFPNITFVWKYEKPEDHISEGIANLVEATFVPQKEMLQDPRLSLFITHCGLASTLEAMMAGVPVIAIPVSSDQNRNAQVLKRGGGGILMDKKELESSEAIERNIGELLDNESYRTSARRIASLIENSPYSGRENFLRHLDFLIKFGPLPSMRIPTHKQSFIEHHMIDVYVFVALSPVFVIGVLFVLFYAIRSALCFGLRKIKRD